MRSRIRLIGLIATLLAPALMSAQTYPKATDPRRKLKPGRFDAGVAAKNMRLMSFSKKPAQFDTVRGLPLYGHHATFGSKRSSPFMNNCGPRSKPDILPGAHGHLA